jgi:MSHA biogenesis protein MshO
MAPTSVRQRGFTLIELVMVIVILGAVGGMVAVFMRGPIDAYFASARRAGLTDVADTTVRRMARDIRKALPNSIRMPGPTCLEFIPTKTGGRYRTDGAGALAINSAVTAFNMLGSNAVFAGAPMPADQRISDGDLVVVYNLGIPGSDAYDNVAPLNRSVVQGAPTVSTNGVPTPANETTITINAANAVIFPLASGGNRFHVVPGAEQVVGYACTSTGTGLDANGTGNGNLIRYVTVLPRTAAQQSSCANAIASPTSQSILATNVSACSFSSTDVGNALQRNGLVSMVLQITNTNETVSLQHEVHVDNTP